MGLFEFSKILSRYAEKIVYNTFHMKALKIYKNPQKTTENLYWDGL